jgi:hypothetical protein
LILFGKMFSGGRIQIMNHRFARRNAKMQGYHASSFIPEKGSVASKRMYDTRD